MALTNHLQGLTLPDDIGGVLWHGYPHPDPEPDNYLYAQHIPNDPLTKSISGMGGMLRGFFQVNVVMRQGENSEGQQVGPFQANHIAGLLVEHFKGQVLYQDGLQVKVPSIPAIAPPIIETGKITVPVSIEYQAPIYEV
ncbi:phage tail terminator-like protein [Pseudovibrio sp. POLY-S9]|uniref:phage tail terminator-like protein n=1 Tax=Pseudovibrio sp. POLY-S9 TaxID=1576596 RepID=UPI001379FA11|nr:phage tail terminator-like protein [Pseudovibrio sp. POLY-S9]